MVVVEFLVVMEAPSSFILFFCRSEQVLLKPYLDGRKRTHLPYKVEDGKGRIPYIYVCVCVYAYIYLYVYKGNRKGVKETEEEIEGRRKLIRLL